MSKQFNPCIVVADRDELQPIKEFIEKFSGFPTIPVIHTGIGLVNSAASVARLKQCGYDMIINIGTCGSKSLEIGTICEPAYFFQSDFNAGSPCPQLDPCSVNSGDAITICKSVKEDKICFSGSSFVTRDSLIMQQGFRGIFDMEAYGFAHASKLYSIPFVALKIVSDNLSLNEHRDYLKVLHNSVIELRDTLESIMVTGIHAVE